MKIKTFSLKRQVHTKLTLIKLEWQWKGACQELHWRCLQDRV